MHLQSFTRRLSAFGLIGVLALVLALTGASLTSAQATPDASTPVAGVGGGTTATGGDTTTTTTTTTAGTGAALPSTGTGDSSPSGFGGLIIVLAAAAAVVVAAVSARTFARRS